MVTHVTDTAKFYVAFESRVARYNLTVLDPDVAKGDSSDVDILWIRKQVTWLMQQDLDSVGADPTRVPPGQAMNIVPRFSMFLATKDSLCQRLRDAGARGSLPCFLWPNEREAWEKHATQHENAVYIFKEVEASNALGTSLVKGVAAASTQLASRTGVLQQYVTDPVTIDVKGRRYKIDLRVYAVAPSWDPLRVYVSKLGYVRVAGAPYSNNLNNLNAHLTNSAQNAMYLRLTFGELKERLEAEGMDFGRAWDAIVLAVGDALAAFRHTLSCTNTEAPYPCGDGNFQSFAADIILDTSMNVYTAEINADPSLKLRSDKVNAESDVRFVDEFSMLGFLGNATMPVPFTSADAHTVCAAHAWNGDVDCVTTLVSNAAQVEAMCREKQLSGSYVLAYPTANVTLAKAVRSTTPEERTRVALDALLYAAFAHHC
jgi:hypothetical protein